jgi:hypothetical protein
LYSASTKAGGSEGRWTASVLMVKAQRGFAKSV